MYTNILSVLRCPHCGGEFELTAAGKEGEEILEGKIACGKGHVFYIRQGILDFQSQEQENLNSWSEYIGEEGYDDLGQKIEARKTEKQKKIDRDFLEAIVGEAVKLKSGFLLDVASGRGILLGELVKTVSADVNLISTDLSFRVLTFDRAALKRTVPQVKVNYIACDATNLPVRDGSVDMVCTYAGFTNMMDLMENGIREAARVLKDGAPLINSPVYMEKNAEGARKAARYFAENQMEGAENIFLREELLTVHRKYFSSVREEIIYEGIAEGVECDLIPCAGEWFANALLVSS